MRKRLIVTGASGQLGSELHELYAEKPECDVTFLDRRALDFSDVEAIKAYFEVVEFDALINCAAYTAVDLAESEPDGVDALNHRAVAALAAVAKRNKALLVHISTDYVFDGTGCRPYTEEDTTNPQSVYGRSKLLGEEAIREIAPEAVIIRTSWLYSSHGNNFVKTMLRLGRERERLGIVFDQVGTPTYARDLAEAIVHIAASAESGTKVPQTYHFSNEGVCSWYDFAQAVFELSGVSCRVDAIETQEYPTPAKRPYYSVLNKRKIKERFGLEIPHWRESLKQCLKRLEEREYMKTILVTGCAGFIGSNFVPYFLEKHLEYRLVNLDVLTYAGNLENLQEVEGDPRYSFVQGDICDRDLVASLFAKYDVRGVIHFAAESHVDNSIKDPGVFVRTNVTGTFTLLDAAYRHWMEKPFVYRNGYGGCRFHHISTDEVYGTLGETGLFTETTPYAPNSPYSASKAGSDMLVRSYHHTYGMDTVITNCSNNYGPKQHDEKLIPTIIRKALAGDSIPIYGDGRNIRDWLYVLDHCKGIDLAYHQGKSGEVYNIGGRNERDNNYIASKVCEILDEQSPKASGSYKAQITYVEDRAGHDRRYAIDATKIETKLGWSANETFETGILKTVLWYLEKYRD